MDSRLAKGTTDVTALLSDLQAAPVDATSRRRRRMQSFHASVRERVEELSSASRAIEDLADSFPALLFALSTDYATPARRRKALSLVMEGAPLRTAADALGIAWWVRRLPAQAFIEPLRTLPDDDAFNERVASFLPPSGDQARSWLWTVSYGAHACGPSFALWAAGWASRQRRTFDSSIGRDHFRYMAAWAWHAEQPAAPGSALLRRPWSAQMGLRRAMEELTVWRRRLRLALCLGGGERPLWVEEGDAQGYAFVALKTPADFIAESEAMDNCLDQFADRLEAGRSRVYSIRRDGRPVADLEIGTDELEAGMPTVLQLRGPRNRKAQPEIWRATYSWLGSRNLRPLVPVSAEAMSGTLKRTARIYWKPYLAALPADLAAELAEVISGDLGFRIDPRPRARPAKPSTAPALQSVPRRAGARSA